VVPIIPEKSHDDQFNGYYFLNKTQIPIFSIEEIYKLEHPQQAAKVNETRAKSRSAAHHDPAEGPNYESA